MIYIGFSTPNKFKPFSFLIKLYQRTKYSHVYVKFFDRYHKEWLIYEASRGEVHLMTYDNWLMKNKNITYFEFEVPDERKRLFVKWALQQLQKPYSVKNIFGLLLFDLFKIQIFKDDKRAFICSELVVHAMDENLDFDKPIDYVTPKDVYNKLVEIELKRL